MEVRIRTADDVQAVHLGEVALEALALDAMIRLLEVWGVRDGAGIEYGVPGYDITGQVVYEAGAAFFEIVLHDEEQ